MMKFQNNQYMLFLIIHNLLTQQKIIQKSINKDYLINSNFYKKKKVKYKNK